MSRNRVAALLLALAAAIPARAETFRLDDSMSQVFPPSADWDWVPFSARSGNTTLQIHLRVNVRIDTRAWVGKQVRIFMVLPLEAGGPVGATWEARGPLLPGRLNSGERTLVYAGTIGAPVLEDTLNVRLTTDARLRTATTRRVAFGFELDRP